MKYLVHIKEMNFHSHIKMEQLSPILNQLYPHGLLRIL